MSTYTKLELGQISESVRHWKRRLGLDGWDIEVRVKKLKPRTIGMRCCRSVSYNRAVIQVNPWLLANEPPKSWHAGRRATLEDVEEHVVHELLHCVVGPLGVWSERANGQMNREVLGRIEEEYSSREEQIVDLTARALIRQFPPSIVQLTQ